MRTIFLGASQRRETNETVRRRLTSLFAATRRGGASRGGGRGGPAPSPVAIGDRAGGGSGSRPEPPGRPGAGNGPPGHDARAVTPSAATTVPAAAPPMPADPPFPAARTSDPPGPSTSSLAARVRDRPGRGRAVQDGLVRDGPVPDEPGRPRAAGGAAGALDAAGAAVGVIRSVAAAVSATGEAAADRMGEAGGVGPSGTVGAVGARQPRRAPFAVPAALMLDRRAALGLAALLLLAVGYAVQHFWVNRPEPVVVPAATAAGSTPTASHGPSGPPGAPAPTVVVDVAGKVEHPGLRTLPTGSRVADALRAAGGALPGIATDGLNLARVLSDGEQILVGAPAGQGGGGSTPGALLSLNQATLEQLDALPGVGPTLAQRILLYRRQHGPFRSVDQLHEISGIGQRKYEEIKDLLTP